MAKLSLGIIVVFMLSAAACGGKDDSGKNTNQDKTKTTANKAPKGPAQFDEAKYKAIADGKIAGFELDKQRSNVRKDLVRLTYAQTQKNAAGKQVQIGATVQACMMCKKMDLAVWKANPHLRKGTENEKLIGTPGHVWELSTLELSGGKKAIAVYEMGYFKKDKSTFRSNGVRVFYNNGVNMVTLMVGLKGFMKGESVEALSKSMPKKDVMAAAKAFMDAMVKHF
jgi:hypothetical protein